MLKGAQRLLENVIAIHCEVEFAPVYQDQPLFSETRTLAANAASDWITKPFGASPRFVLEFTAVP